MEAVGAGRFDDASGLKNMQQLIQLRWIAVVGQLVTIEVVYYGFGISLPINLMLAVLAGLTAFNLASLLRWRVPRAVTKTELFVSLLVDVGALTAQLYLSGGVTTPFVFLSPWEPYCSMRGPSARWSASPLRVSSALRCLAGPCRFHTT
jgi:two-component system sensor histidine kinase RegB